MNAANQQKALEQINLILISAMEKGFYGNVTIEIKDGEVHQITAMETIRPPFKVKKHTFWLNQE